MLSFVSKEVTARILCRLVATLCFLLGMVACGISDYSKEISPGYSLARTSSGCSGVINDNGLYLVGPSDYGILIKKVGGLIVGNLDTEEAAYGVEEVADRYFVIDTKAGVVEKEMSRQDYKEVLKKHGINDEPILFRPNKLTWNF